jgi:hypothetical protein
MALHEARHAQERRASAHTHQVASSPVLTADLQVADLLWSSEHARLETSNHLQPSSANGSVATESAPTCTSQPWKHIMFAKR